MSNKPNVRRTVYYKSVEMPSTNRNLQELIEDAVAKGSQMFLAKNRHQLINSSSQDYILLNHHINYRGCFFGQLIFVDSDTTKSVLTLDEQSQEYKIAPIDISSLNVNKNESAQNTTEELKNQFINSILYFGIFENHLVLVQSPSLKTNHLEGYLRWILSEAQLLDSNELLALTDKVTKETSEILRNNPAKEIRIGANIGVECSPEALKMKSQDSIEERMQSNAFSLAGKGAEILKTLFGDNKLDGLRLQDSLEKANLKMYVTMTYERNTSDSGQKVMDSFAKALRHQPEEDYMIKLKNGGTIKGTDLKISKVLKLDTINGVINEIDLWEKLYHWLADNADAGS